MKTYITFGQVHTHSVNGKKFDKDCVAVIHADSEADARVIAMGAFGIKWCFSYSEDQWDESKMEYFPRGYIEVN